MPLEPAVGRRERHVTAGTLFPLSLCWSPGLAAVGPVFAFGLRGPVAGPVVAHEPLLGVEGPLAVRALAAAVRVDWDLETDVT